MATSNKAFPIIIGAIVLVAVVWFGSNMSTDDELTGTVAPAERYRAEQPGTDDIELGDQELQAVLHHPARVPQVLEARHQRSLELLLALLLTLADRERLADRATGRQEHDEQ